MPIKTSRINKLQKIIDSGQVAYPRSFYGRVTIESVLTVSKSNVGIYDDISLLKKKNYKIAGRISARRNHGENIFFDIFDQTGSIQLLRTKFIDSYDIEGKIQEELARWENISELDIGDMVGVCGTLGANSRGEPLFLISELVLLAKALKDSPANFHGLKNPEMKYRHRELDLLSSAESRDVFKKRAEIIFEIRKYLNERDFIEIETPILQPIYGGATARPFKTEHNALGQDFFLSISSELYLKRAMVGGFDRVYSFSRCFRNEGISPEHNPEFTNLEIFESCKTAQDMEEFVQDLISHLCVFTNYKKIKNLISKWGTRPHDPIFNNKLPAQDWPLSRTNSLNNNMADAWELYIDEMEIASGASDLNDPREQEKRLKESESKSSPDRDYDPYDKNYIKALEMGALPVAGAGIGIDRLCMLLLGKDNIRDVLIFPLLKSI